MVLPGTVTGVVGFIDEGAVEGFVFTVSRWDLHGDALVINSVRVMRMERTVSPIFPIRGNSRPLRLKVTPPAFRTLNAKLSIADHVRCCPGFSMIMSLNFLSMVIFIHTVSVHTASNEMESCGATPK